MMGEGGTLPPLLVCEMAVFGADNVNPRMMLSSCNILVMASDLQSARNVSIGSPAGLKADFQRSV
jgi:hypothetical protein